jgi:hypothetical protein
MDEVGERLAVNPLGPNPVRVEATTAHSPGTAWLRDREDVLTAWPRVDLTRLVIARARR